MTTEEELQALREENRMLKALVAELLPVKEELAQAQVRIKELEERLVKDSRTSSKPPSSDGLGRLPRSARRPSGKRPGGQAGHAGQTLTLVKQPDEVVRHRPSVCRQCQAMKLGEKMLTPYGLEGLANVVAIEGKSIWAVHLWGAAEALQEVIGISLPPFFRGHYVHAMAEARTQLGEQAFASAWAEGRTMTPEQVLAAKDR
ncbi:MAG: DUF6444 domain-containing protein [Ktedonobacteraceae bacterium]